MGLILLLTFGFMTLMGVLAWWYAAHYDGLVGTTRALTIISVIGLIGSGVYVAKNGLTSHHSASPTTSKQASLNSSQYFAKKESQETAAKKQAQNEQYVLKKLQEAYKDKVGTVSFDQATKTYTVTPTVASFKTAIGKIWKYPTQNSKSIKQLEQSYLKMSASIDKALGNGYTLQLNKTSDGPVIIKAKAGKVTVSGLNN